MLGYLHLLIICHLFQKILTIIKLSFIFEYLNKNLILVRLKGFIKKNNIRRKICFRKKKTSVID